LASVNFYGTIPPPTCGEDIFEYCSKDLVINVFHDYDGKSFCSEPAMKNLYRITYDLDGGSVDPENPTICNIRTDEVTLHNPTKEAYNFVGWNGSNGADPEMTVTIPTDPEAVPSDKRFTANWEAVPSDSSSSVESSSSKSSSIESSSSKSSSSKSSSSKSSSFLSASSVLGKSSVSSSESSTHPESDASGSSEGGSSASLILAVLLLMVVIV